MIIKSGSSGSPRSGRKSPTVGGLKLFRPVYWYENRNDPALESYMAHLLTELGRLEMGVDEFVNSRGSRHFQDVLSDLLEWFGQHPSSAYARLTNWRSISQTQMMRRLEIDPLAKPRIELSALISKNHNLSVRWYPKGWRSSEIDWRRPDRDERNLITLRRWPEPPDFCWFNGDEEAKFQNRASNELMFIRGVGLLDPDPNRKYGPLLTFNRDVVDSNLICAVRAAYEALIEQLSHSFEVKVLHEFDFTLAGKTLGQSNSSPDYDSRRVVGWTLEDVDRLKARREQEAAAEQERNDCEELANFEERHGFTLDAFMRVLAAASTAPRSKPSDERINREAGRRLRAGGFTQDAGDIRRIRGIIERRQPELLPDALRPTPAPVGLPAPEAGNIRKFPSGAK